MSFVDRLIAVAKIETGHHEEPRGSNWGPQVRKYLAAAGISTPAPWCCAFLVYCVKQIGGMIIPTASTTALIEWARHNQLLIPKPERGCLFVLQHRDGRGLHTGLVTDVGLLRFSTVEGNSNAGGSPEGWEVIARSRRRYGVKQVFIRLPRPPG